MDPIVLQADEGEAIWFLDTLVTVKAASESTGSWALVEIAAAGHAPPLHAHHSEDEAFYVLEGEMSIICGDRRFNAAAGSFVLIPRCNEGPIPRRTRLQSKVSCASSSGSPPKGKPSPPHSQLPRPTVRREAHLLRVA